MLVTPYVNLSYINAATGELLLNFLSTFVCEKCDEAANNQIHTIKQGGTHGQFFTGMSLGERNIRLSGHVKHGINLEAAMQALHSVFNPTIAGILRYENKRMKIYKEIPCRISELPQVFWSRNQLRFDIVLVALDPFWKGQSLTEIIAQTVKEFSFPSAIPARELSFGTRHSTLESKFENKGNVESGFLAVLRARYGTVVNPEIRNEVTGEKIRLNYTMRANDVITILNDLQEKRVEINGVNGFRHLDAAGTTFFKIDVGTNRIGFRADTNVSNLFVNVRYTPNYTFAEG